MKTQKNTPMRFLQSLIVMAVIFIGTTAMAQTKANFSGKWQLDLVNSSNLAKDNMKVIAIDQDPVAMIVNRTGVTAENSLKHSTDTIYQDGAAHLANKNKAKDFQLPAGKISGFSRTSTLAWSDDGKSLTINTSYNLAIDDKPFTVKTVEKWALDSTGQKLIISGSADNAGKTENYTDIYVQMEKK